MKFSKITISGRICTGKTTLFWGLQEKLIWPTFSTSQFFRDYARTHQLVLEKAEEQNEKITKKVDFRVADMLKNKGSLLVEGWMAGIMANQHSDILKVLLMCSDKVRISRFAERENISFKEAAKKIRERETNVFKILSVIYKRADFFDSKNYDLILDTTKTNKKRMVDIILQKIGFSE